MKTLTWLFPMGTTRGFFFSAAMASVYGGMNLFYSVIAIMKNRKEFFATKIRSEPPKCLMDRKLGQHNFVQCRTVRKIPNLHSFVTLLFLCYAITGLYLNLVVLWMRPMKAHIRHSMLCKYNLQKTSSHTLKPSAVSIENISNYFTPNIKLHYVSNGDPNRPLILFLHGFPEMWYSWRHQLKEFSGDYFTVALNMRGYGDSDKPKGIANYSLDKLVDDIKDFVNSLGKNKCILVSHDWGGLVGWTVAAHYPEIVDKFIVCNAPNVKYFKQTIEYDWTQFWKSWYIYFFNAPYLPELRFRCNDYKAFEYMFKKYCTEEEIEGYKYYFSKPYGLSAPINYYRALQRGYAKEFTKQIENKRIKCPTLVIWGKDDMALSESLAEDSCQLCDDYTIKMIDNCSHWTPFDKPDLVNQYIRDFLNRK